MATETSHPWLADLNPMQRVAVLHGNGPLLIVAGAGTGKTKTLACRVAHLIHHGVSPERILLLTFTRRASAEMIRRAERLIGSTDGAVSGKVWGGTFHAVSNRLLRMYGRAVGLPEDFTVMDESDAADLLNLVRNELGVGKGDRRFPRKATLQKIYSRLVNAQEPLERTLETRFPWCAADREGIRSIFDGYVERKHEQHLLDYDDLLVFWKALCETPSAGRAVEDRFDHVLVDEYQDTNALQAELLLSMRRSNKNICVVGDDAQSIYSFRAATVRNILDFPKQFPGARVVTLEQNYRSITPILEASNAVMEPARERYTKSLWSRRPSERKPILWTCHDEAEQTERVCRHILDHLEQGVALMQQAVLFRAGHHSAHLEIELARRNIPFHKYGGLKFVETAHIKDMIALLRILENPYDELSWFRVLQLMEGVGPRTARRVIAELGVRRAVSAAPEVASDDRNGRDPVRRMIGRPPSVPSAARESIQALRAMFVQCRGASGSATAGGAEEGDVGDDAPALSVQIEVVRRFYEPLCERAFENPKIRLRDIEQLEQIARRYRSRSRFIADLTLDPPVTTSDLAGPPFLEEDYLTLSTIHSAKGCEWTVVHVIHAADGMIPSDMATGDDDGIEEERRLFYVALTRAKDWLYVYFPLRYYHRMSSVSDAHGYAQLTRFLPDRARARFEQRAADVDSESDGAASGGRSGRGDPYGSLRRLWAG